VVTGGAAVRLDDVLRGGIGTEGGDTLRHAVADGRVRDAMGRGQLLPDTDVPADLLDRHAVAATAEAIAAVGPALTALPGPAGAAGRSRRWGTGE
jgi:hypothetical protein